MSDILGLDVSRYQGDMDFVKAKSNGADFVIIRSSQGKDYSDPLFKQNYARAKAAGLLVGVYHFCTGDNALSQAAWFKQQLNGVELDFPVALDCEKWGGSITNQAIVDVIARQFYDYQGFPLPWIYTNADSGNYIFTNPVFSKYPLWVAYWSSRITPLFPNVWKSKGTYVVWQKGITDGEPWGTKQNTQIDWNIWGNESPFPGETPVDDGIYAEIYIHEKNKLYCGTLKEKC